MICSLLARWFSRPLSPPKEDVFGPIIPGVPSMMETIARVSQRLERRRHIRVQGRGDIEDWLFRESRLDDRSTFMSAADAIEEAELQGEPHPQWASSLVHAFQIEFFSAMETKARAITSRA